ncbi:MAG: Maf family protein [Planctomycetota bacterium]
MVQASRRSIVLASRSPRRLELAVGEGWLVTVVRPPESAEASQPARGSEEALEAYVVRLARAKAEAVAASGMAGTLVACDTLSEVDGVMLGKPADRREARRMLEALGGKQHRVLTGLCVWQLPGGVPQFKVVESLLEMGFLSEEFLEWYLDSGLWQDKAGACGFQDERLPLALVAGSPSNVVGLPLEALRTMLDELEP